jgi:hypothetical protein
MASKPVEIRITEASISYVHPSRRNVFLAHEALETVWINKSTSGNDLFLLRSSPNDPRVAYSNKRLARLMDVVPAVAGSYNAAGQATRHIVWISPQGVLHSLRFSGNSQAETATAPLPVPDAELVDPPFTAQDGTLSVVLADRNGEAATLLRWQDQGRPLATRIRTSPPLRSPWGALWGRDGTLTLAWTAEDQRSVAALSFALAAAPPPSGGKVLFRAPGPILDLALGQRGRSDGAGFDCLLTVLFRDPSTNELVRKQVDVASGKPGSEVRLAADPALAARVVDSALAADLAPRYLIAAADGSIRFIDAAFARLLPVMAGGGKPLKASDYPSIVVTSTVGRLPRTYVRFVEGGKRLSYRPVD